MVEWQAFPKQSEGMVFQATPPDLGMFSIEQLLVIKGSFCPVNLLKEGQFLRPERALVVVISHGGTKTANFHRYSYKCLKNLKLSL